MEINKQADEMIHELAGLCGVLPEYWDTGVAVMLFDEMARASDEMPPQSDSPPETT